MIHRDKHASPFISDAWKKKAGEPFISCVGRIPASIPLTGEEWFKIQELLAARYPIRAAFPEDARRDHIKDKNLRELLAMIDVVLGNIDGIVSMAHRRRMDELAGKNAKRHRQLTRHVLKGADEGLAFLKQLHRRR